MCVRERERERERERDRDRDRERQREPESDPLPPHVKTKFPTKHTEGLVTRTKANRINTHKFPLKASIRESDGKEIKTFSTQKTPKADDYPILG